MNSLRLPKWLTAALAVFTFALFFFVFTAVAQAADAAQADPGAPATDGGKFTFATLVALAGAVVIIARIIVKLTPTPKDDTILEKVIEWLKHLGLVIKCLLLISVLSLLTSGCAGRTTAQVVRALSKDPASLHVRITSIYGTIEVARTAPNTNSPAHAIGADGTITVK